jgi:anaerobic magnesium-protoporphyrin IX monomethyl ester cyclase
MLREKHAVDIVLVKPGSQKQLYGALSAFALTALEPPLWAALLAAHLRAQGYSVALFDAEVEGWDYRQTAQRIQEAKPLLAAIVVSGTNPSASTMNMTGAGAISKELKDLAPEIKTVLTGLHPSALPERTLREETVDFVCQGEGFYTIPALIGSLKEGQEDANITGLWQKQNGRIISNAAAPLWENLDVLPMPAWDLLPMNKYRAHNWHCFGRIEDRQPYGVIYTSLGCPFRCSFCCINALFGKPGIRYRSPERVIEEIDFLVRQFNMKNIKIIDEMFAFKEEHVVRLCDLILERGYDLNLWAYARVNTVTEKMLRKMKAAGINWIAYGFESGSKKILQGVTKGYDLDTVAHIVRMTRDAGLYICGNYIFGLPEDDFDSMQETLDLAFHINAEWANFYAATAYPGSQLYRQALQENWPLPESWAGYSPYSYEALPLPTKHLSGSEVLRFRDQAFQEYFTSGTYLKMITRIFGEPTARHIREMASQYLRRKVLAASEPVRQAIQEGKS